jgi:ribosome-associated toxin RatA of RatAB toxin-antitoxin module
MEQPMEPQRIPTLVATLRASLRYPPFGDSKLSRLRRLLQTMDTPPMRSFLSCLVIIASVSLAAPAFAFDAEGVDQSAVEKLSGGAPIVVVEEHEGGGLKLVTGGVLILAPPADVWKVVTDYSRYTEWMPDVAEINVLKDEGVVKEIQYKLVFKLSIITRKVQYTLQTIETKNKRIEWELIDGDFDHSIGGWQLMPTHDGAATMAYYSTFTNLKSMGALIKGILDQQPALEMAIQVSTAITVVQKLRDRVDAIQRGEVPVDAPPDDEKK